LTLNLEIAVSAKAWLKCGEKYCPPIAKI